METEPSRPVHRNVGKDENQLFSNVAVHIVMGWLSDLGKSGQIGVEHRIENASCHSMIAFWFCQLTAEHRVLYRPTWLANSQCAACKGQANSKQIARSGRQLIINGPSLPSINNGLLFPSTKQFASEI